MEAVWQTFGQGVVNVLGQNHKGFGRFSGSVYYKVYYMPIVNDFCLAANTLSWTPDGIGCNHTDS